MALTDELQCVSRAVTAARLNRLGVHLNGRVGLSIAYVAVRFGSTCGLSHWFQAHVSMGPPEVLVPLSLLIWKGHHCWFQTNLSHSVGCKPHSLQVVGLWCPSARLKRGLGLGLKTALLGDKTALQKRLYGVEEGLASVVCKKEW